MLRCVSGLLVTHLYSERCPVDVRHSSGVLPLSRRSAYHGEGVEVQRKPLLRRPRGKGVDPLPKRRSNWSDQINFGRIRVCLIHSGLFLRVSRLLRFPCHMSHAIEVHSSSFHFAFHRFHQLVLVLRAPFDTVRRYILVWQMGNLLVDELLDIRAMVVCRAALLRGCVLRCVPVLWLLLDGG